MYIPSHQFELKEHDHRDKAPLTQGNGNTFEGAKYAEFSDGTIMGVPSGDLSQGNFRNAAILSTIGGYVLAFEKLQKLKKERPSGTPVVNRYFVKDKVHGNITEVSQADYQDAESNYQNLETAQMTWFIAGPIYDTEIEGYMMQGTFTKNKVEVERLERTFPGVSLLTTDFTYLQDPRYLDQSQDLTELRRFIVLPSPS